MLTGAIDSVAAHRIEAWTRDDDPALRWYRSLGMTEDSHYLHVYKDWDEPSERLDGLPVVKAFMHCTDMSREPELRQRFRRVHICRRMSVEIANLRQMLGGHDRTADARMGRIRAH